MGPFSVGTDAFHGEHQTAPPVETAKPFEEDEP
jgi:hypothetical protein